MANTYTPNYTGIVQGQIVALALHQPVAGLACYVGEVQAVDARGVRITLVDWTTGLFAGLDFFTPWTNVEGALVATSAHHPNGDELARFQQRCEETAAERDEHRQPVVMRHYDQG
jgi:hypothetical protein